MMKRKITITIDEYTLQHLETLSKILDRPLDEVISVISELLAPGLIAYTQRILETLHKRGLLTLDPNEAFKVLAREGAAPRVEKTEQKPSEDSVEKLIQLLRERGELSVGEAINIVKPEKLRELLESGLVKKVGSKIVLAET